MTSVSPRVIPEIAVAPAHRNLGNHNSKSSFERGGHQCVDTPIRLTINEIVKIAAAAFVSSLVEDAPAAEGFGEKVSNFAVVGFAQLSLLNIRTDNNVRFQLLLIAFFHICHEMICGFQRRAVNEVVVVPESSRAGKEQSDDKQKGEPRS